jgi:methylenetetrahydrofolate dehydrogenase (NADP+)/methenyltetrahydrofolate cyclohydrolase
MPAQIIDGEKIATSIKDHIAREAAALASAGRAPRLVAVQVGANPSSKIYTNNQAKQAQAVGIEYQLVELPEQTTQAQLVARLDELNTDTNTSGIILQMPLPSHIDARAVQTRIAPHKDVEAVNPANMGQLLFGSPLVAPCTPMAAMEMLLATCPNIRGKETVIVGRSEIVGKPLAIMLLEKSISATVTICHTGTVHLDQHCRAAEVLIAATGLSQMRWLSYSRERKAGKNPPRPDLSPLISGDMIRPGAIVIDVAINRIPRGLDGSGDALKKPDGKNDMVTTGDVDFAAACEKASAITPVPGGVGPVTVAMLLRNTLACAKAARRA